MIATMLFTAIMFGWGILTAALPDRIYNAHGEKQQTGNRLVFAHFMVCMGFKSDIKVRRAFASLIETFRSELSAIGIAHQTTTRT